jgi:hypothetical protein
MQMKLILPALTEATLDLMIRVRHLPQVTTLLEAVLGKVTRQRTGNNLVERPESRSQQLVNVENAPADHTV